MSLNIVSFVFLLFLQTIFPLLHFLDMITHHHLVNFSTHLLFDSSQLTIIINKGHFTIYLPVLIIIDIYWTFVKDQLQLNYLTNLTYGFYLLTLLSSSRSQNILELNICDDKPSFLTPIYCNFKYLKARKSFELHTYYSL